LPLVGRIKNLRATQNDHFWHLRADSFSLKDRAHKPYGCEVHIAGAGKHLKNIEDFMGIVGVTNHLAYLLFGRQ
jgi:hypothetical protein